MSDWREQLEEMLANEDASASRLDAEARSAARNALSEASASNETEAFLQLIDSKYPFRQAAEILPLRAYCRGWALLQLGRNEEGIETLTALADSLRQKARWKEVAELANEVLTHVASQDMARLLARAAEHLGVDQVPAGSLANAHRLFPADPAICWLEAERLEAAGEGERALALFTGCLTDLIHAQQFEKVEEVLLRLEDAEDPENIATALETCVKLAMAKQWKLAETYLEPLLPKVKKAGLARHAWDLLLKVLPKAPAESKIREFLVAIAPEALPDVDGVGDLLGRSGLLDPKVKTEKAIHKLNQLLEFAPGYRVLHQSWGAGRIRANEGDFLIIDFAEKPGHKMSVSLARNALKVIPADDLRVLWLEKPEEVKEMARSRPADLAYLAIRELGGKATTQELRRRLTPEIIPTSTWSTWWKNARAEMEDDDRFDFSESFRQCYAIREKGARATGDTILPRLDRRRGIRANLNLLKRFLDQHPEQRDEAIRMYTPVLLRWMKEERTHPEAALAVCMLLRRWDRLDPKELVRVLRRALPAGVEANAFSDESDQHFIVTHAMQVPGLEQEAVIFALGSRLQSIRRLGEEALARDPKLAEETIGKLLRFPEERPQAAFAVILESITEKERLPFYPSPWRAAAALCRLAERSGRDSLRTQAMRLFNPKSSLAEVLRSEPEPDEEVQLLLEDTFNRWRQSERYLFPILEFFESVGLAELVERARTERTAATNRLLRSRAGEEEHAYGGLYLTRAGYRRLERERDHLAKELRTTVAQTIQRAREMGDLSENAEYDAAKEKQANYTKRIASIGEMLSRATLIEDVEVPEGEVGPGCLVELRKTDGAEPSSLKLWLLGEGDEIFGPEVVSCTGPLGQSLLGKKVGDRVKIRDGAVEYEAEIVGCERRLPPVESTEAQ